MQTNRFQSIRVITRHMYGLYFIELILLNEHSLFLSSSHFIYVSILLNIFLYSSFIANKIQININLSIQKVAISSIKKY